MSDEAKTVTIEVSEWRRLRRIEDAAVWCIGYLYWKTSAESRAVVRRLEKATSQPTTKRAGYEVPAKEKTMSDEQTDLAGNSFLCLLRAASRLNVWLRENVGDNADWPVRLQCSDVATADALACLLSELSAEVKAALDRGVSA